MLSYTGDTTYDTLLASALIASGVIFAISWFIPSPYGRFASSRHGVSLSPPLGWFLMELPATVTFLFFFFQGPHWRRPVPLFFLCVWLIHYGNRGFYFPAKMRVAKGDRATFSLMVVATGWLVTSLHGYFFATYFARLGPNYDVSWFSDGRFVLGMAIYYASYVGNLASDATLRNLRSEEEAARGEKIYRVPNGGLFRWVSCPSYLTELVGWAGLALGTWSLAGVFILAISAANLIPRAIKTHRWYRERFPDYPADRKALVPYLW
jgi:3-oxo-5-alpha-steroid 4-dehydrogenase 1